MLTMTQPTNEEDQPFESSTEIVGARTELQSHIPYMGLTLNDLTVQQEKLVLLISSGMTVAAAGRGAGYSSSSAALEASKKPAVQTALQYYREQMREEVKFDRKNAHSMYMEAYTSSVNATEMKNTVDSLVKLHGLTTPDTAVQVNVNLNATAKQLERLTDEELLEIAGKTTNYLEPDAT